MIVAEGFTPLAVGDERVYFMDGFGLVDVTIISLGDDEVEFQVTGWLEPIALPYDMLGVTQAESAAMDAEEAIEDIEVMETGTTK